MDTLVLPAGEAKRVEVYSVNGMLVMTQEKCTSVGLSAFACWLLYGTGLYGRRQSTGLQNNEID